MTTKIEDTAVCPICQHGAIRGEQLNPDGSCPYRSIALAENHRAADAKMRAEIENLTHGTWHLRPGARP